jgi:hypothetical protein
MTKQHYQLFADMVAAIDNDSTRELFISKCSEVFARDNERFSSDIFREWIDRQREGRSLKGLRPSRNYRAVST